MHTHTKTLLSILIASSLLTGCVVAPKTARMKTDDGAVANEARKQRELAVKNYYSQYERLQTVAWPVLKNNVDLCEDNITQSTGMFAENIYHFKDADMQQAARDARQMDTNVRVTLVTPQSPAEQAGIVKGDIIKKVNGKVIPATKEAPKIMASIIKDNAEKTSWELEIEHEGQTKNLTLNTVSVCNYGVQLQEADIVNAFADGSNIILTQGMMRFTENDKELGLVVGHEIAHNIMEHMSAKTTNYILGTILDVVAAAYGVDTQNSFGKMSASAYSQDFEAEADYVGMYLIAKSGYELEGSADFWRRMASIHPGSINTNHTASHPATPERFVAIENSIDEINQKIANNEPLDFEMKGKQEQPINTNKAFGS
jgi:membrane-associated protease RseP (regulator of RpoE activity)